MGGKHKAQEVKGEETIQEITGKSIKTWMYLYMWYVYVYVYVYALSAAVIYYLYISHCFFFVI